jgi:Holliday junction resolvase RusA-like endonuclease
METGEMIERLAEALGVEAGTAFPGEPPSPQDLKKALRFVEEHEGGNAMTEISFEVPGSPPFSMRPRSARIRDGNNQVVGLRVFAADAEAQDTLAIEVRRRIPGGHVPFAGEVELFINVYRSPPASFPEYKRILCELGYVRPDRKPDYDNFSKIITDAMTGLAFVDDAQVVVGVVGLFYSSRPRLEVTMRGRARKMAK